MAIVTSIQGFSGSGKTRSTKGFMDDYDMDKVLFVRPSKKPISYRNTWKKWDPEAKAGHTIHVTEYAEAMGAIVKFSRDYGKKVIILEDSTFFMTKHFMDTALEVGLNVGSIKTNRIQGTPQCVMAETILSEAA